MKKLRVAIIGQGRSGRDIHGQYFRCTANKQYEVAVVIDKDEFRRERALKEYPGCEVFADYTALYDRKDIDLVVNASYSEMHYPITKDLLQHKLNVLVEKPMGKTYYECLDLIKTAKDNGVTVAAFQQTFVNPFHLGVKELVASGKIGTPLQYSIQFNGFGRRWDWQTVQVKAAGGIYNTGPHPIGLALDYIDFDENATVAFSKLALGLTSGDSDDYAKVIITAPGKAVVDVEVSSMDAFPEPYVVKVMGTRGTISATRTSYKMKYVVDGENPEKPVIFESLEDENRNPAYCSENLKTHDEEGDFGFDFFFDTTAHTKKDENVLDKYDQASKNFYDALYESLVNGAPLPVAAEKSAKVIGIIEAVHSQNPLPVKF